MMATNFENVQIKWRKMSCPKGNLIGFSVTKKSEERPANATA